MQELKINILEIAERFGLSASQITIKQKTNQMDKIISIEKIKSTKTYSNLIEKKQKNSAHFLETRVVRGIITNGYQVYRNTGVMPLNIKGINLQVVNDLIEMDSPDASWMMSSEEVKLMNGKSI